MNVYDAYYIDRANLINPSSDEEKKALRELTDAVVAASFFLAVMLENVPAALLMQLPQYNTMVQAFVTCKIGHNVDEQRNTL